LISRSSGAFGWRELQGGLAGFQGLRPIALALEGLADELADVGLVLDDEHQGARWLRHRSGPRAGQARMGCGVMGWGAGSAEHLSDEARQVTQVHRLLQQNQTARFGTPPILLAVSAGDKDHGRSGRPSDFIGNGPPVDPGHAEIGQHEIVRAEP
jgi:hypothetical protein